MRAKLDSVRSLPKSGYLLTWDDGFELEVGDDFGLALATNLRTAAYLRAGVKRAEHKPGRHFSDEQIDEIAEQLGLRRPQS